MVETAHAQWKIAKIDENIARRLIFPHYIGNAESIFREIFTTESTINVLTAHAPILSSQQSLKMVLRARSDRVLWENGQAEFKYDDRL